MNRQRGHWRLVHRFLCSSQLSMVAAFGRRDDPLLPLLLWLLLRCRDDPLPPLLLWLLPPRREDPLLPLLLLLLLPLRLLLLPLQLLWQLLPPTLLLPPLLRLLRLVLIAESVSLANAGDSPTATPELPTESAKDSSESLSDVGQPGSILPQDAPPAPPPKRSASPKATGIVLSLPY